MKCIMIVDDDVPIGDMLQEVLVREGYLTVRAYSGTEAMLYLESHRPDLILLDLMLPGLSGEEILPRIAGIPVIVVSAKADVTDKVELLLGGAADYITKPFEIQEMLARIAVQLRKSCGAQVGKALPEGGDQGSTSQNSSKDKEQLEFQEITMDLFARLVYVNHLPVKLTRTEYAILKLLMQNPSQVITKSVMLERISLDTPDCVESSLKVHISNLRRKLREAGGKNYIEAVWGIGFKMKED